MSRSFDWTWLDLPRWTPVSVLGTRADRVVGGLYVVDPGMYALTNAAWGSREDPGLGGFLWARSIAVARLVYDCKAGPVDNDGALSPPPPTSVLGFADLTFAGVLNHARAGAKHPPVSASYGFPDGGLIMGEVRVPGREYVFLLANPAPADPAVAVRFNLPI